ncbi:TonB-dependent receptor [hydrothermal vent metagenome]|uniref:TonB-dependent receptor n=1 Tax=hydrothermal vent metagenome TaxID=652676 RepID=A0A3B0VF74_9ZZZZ
MQFRRSILSALIKAAITATVIAPSALLAQDEEGETYDSPVLEEIIVTAQRREQSLADVPLSVAVIDGELLKKQAIEKMADLQFSVPNFTMAESGIGTNVFIRGIGSGNNQGFEQSVGVYVDGIHRGRAQQARAPFFDLQRVEVLRGPQSILFGKNSVAGALNMTTAKPTDEFEGFVGLDYGFTLGESEASVILSGPISDKFRYRIAGRYHEMDGYIENLTLNRDEPQQEDYTLRTTFEYDFTDSFMATLKLESSKFDVVGRNIEINGEVPAAAGPFAGLTYSQILAGPFGQDASVLNNTLDGKRSANGDFSNNDQFEAVLTLDWELDNHILTSITGVSNFEFQDNCDCDFTGANIFTLPLAEKYDQLSQEVRLTSNGGETIDYILGGYYQTSDHEFRDTLTVGANSILVPLLNSNPAFPPGANIGNLFANTAASREALVDTDIFSIFAQFDWYLSDSLTLQLGGRVTYESKDGSKNLTVTAADGSPLSAAQAVVADFYGLVFDFGASNVLNVIDPNISARLGRHPVSGSRSETVFTPDIKLYWDVSGDTMLYASIVQGSKSGGFDFRANNRGASATMEEAFEFENESATSLEFGGKMTLADGAAQLNFAAYLTRFEDLQVSIFDGTLGFNVGNAAKADVMGLEVDGRWQVTNNLTLAGSLALTDFEFKDYTNGRCNFGQAPNGSQAADGFCDYSGQTNQLVSDWQGTFSAIHVHELSGGMELNTAFNLFFTDDYNASASLDPALVQKAYANVNLRIGLSNPVNGWDVALLGQNLTDKQIVLFGGDAPLSGSTFGAIAKYNFMARGRTLAIQFSKKF